MTPMLCRVMCAILMLPCAAVVYVVAFTAAGRRASFVPWDGVNYMIAGSVAWLFVAVYWWAIWRTAIEWTPRRKSGTVVAALEAIAIAGVVGVACSFVLEGLGYWAASVVAPLSWLLLTVYAWREVRDERAARVVGANGPIACPECDYDLTGLRGSTRCPECGTEFTLDELVGTPVERIASDLR